MKTIQVLVVKYCFLDSMDVEQEEEEDEVVKAILASKDIQRNHPPAIQVEDNIAEICFHPIDDLIALASVTGDVFLYDCKSLVH